jgi:predicted sulfurtransferase
MLRGKEVFMFCTGGVRCEKASAFLIERVGVERGSVRQLDGGIMGFLESVDRGGGVWRGKNLVFDGRLTDQGSGDVVGRCVGCEVGCDDYGHGVRCVHCRRRLLVCEKVECAAPRLCGPCGEAYESGTLRKAGRVRAKLEALAG